MLILVVTVLYFMLLLTLALRLCILQALSVLRQLRREFCTIVLHYTKLPYIRLDL